MAFYCDFVFIDVQNNSNRISAIEFPGRAGYKKSIYRCLSLAVIITRAQELLKMTNKNELFECKQELPQ